MKKRVLFINGHLNAGGVERSLVDVLRHFDYTQYEVDLMLLEGGGDYIHEIPSDVHINIYPLNDASGPFLRMQCRNLSQGKLKLFIYRFITQFISSKDIRKLAWARCLFTESQKNYDAIIAYRVGRPLSFAAYILKGRKKIVWWHHGEMNFQGEALLTLENGFKAMDRIVAVSKSSGKLIRKNFPSVSQKVTVIPNMLCADDIRAKAGQYAVSQATDVFQIVSIGNFFIEKNMGFCVSIASRLKKEKVPFHWTLIGSGPKFEEVQNEITQNDLQDEVTCTGKLNNPYPYLKLADLYFHPSLIESQGLTVMEAMAFDKPIVCVASEGPKEFIKSGVNGILINASVEEAVQAILKIWKKEKCLNVGNTLDTFAPKRIIQQIEDSIN